MARRKRRRSAGSRRRRRNPMRSVRRRSGKAISRAAWRRSGYRRNPRRRSRVRRHYRRNPPLFRGVLGNAFDLGLQTTAALAGAGVGRQVTSMVPFTDNPGAPPLIEWGKAALLAIGVKQFTPSRWQRYGNAAALGILFGPTKQLITYFAPAVAGYLGDVMTLPSNFPGQRMLNAYSDNGMSAYVVEDGEDIGLGAYTSNGW